MYSGKCGKIIVGPLLSEVSTCEGTKANIRRWYEAKVGLRWAANALLTNLIGAL